MRITVDIPDDLATEIEQRAGDFTWSRLIIDALTYALAQADTEPQPTEVDRSVSQ